MDILDFFGPSAMSAIPEAPDIYGDKYYYWYPRERAVNNRVCLVAHIDTVFPCSRATPTVTFMDGETILSRPTGLGADDRAGVFACMMLRKKTGCAVLLTDLEEMGCIGARNAAKTMKKYFKKHISYFVEIDRSGKDDMVFYNDEDLRFREFVGKFGFKEARGSFTDISILGRTTLIAGVNISAGYYFAHTKHEVLSVGQLFANIAKIEKLIRAKNLRQYRVKKRNYGIYSGNREKKIVERTWLHDLDSSDFWDREANMMYDDFRYLNDYSLATSQPVRMDM